MTIQYANSFSELLKFHLYCFTRAPLLFGTIAVYAALEALSILGLLSEESSHPIALGDAITEAVLLLLLLIFIWVAIVVITAWDKRSQAVRTITLTDNALIEESSYRWAEFRWPGVTQLKHFMGNLFLYTATGEAIIVPRRVFANDAEWDAFRAFCAERIGRM